MVNRWPKPAPPPDARPAGRPPDDETPAPDRAVQEMLGHQHLATTQIYTHVAIDHLRATIRDYHPHGTGAPKLEPKAPPKKLTLADISAMPIVDARSLKPRRR